MTFLELKQTCKDDFGKDDAAWMAFFGRQLNRGQRHILNEKEWEFSKDYANTFQTVANTAEYTLSETNIKKILNIRVTTPGYERRLRPVNYSAFIASHPGVNPQQDVGTPSVYYATGRSATYQPKFSMYPVPDTAYDITYDFVAEAPVMSDDADTPAFPTAYHDLLVDYVLWKSYQKVRDMKTAAVYKAQFDDGLDLMRGDYQENETSELQTVDYDGQEVE